MGTSVLALLQYALLLAVSTCMLCSKIFCCILAMMGLVLYTVLVQSTVQGWRMHGQIQIVAHTTHTTMNMCFWCCIEKMLPRASEVAQTFVVSIATPVRLACRRQNTIQNVEDNKMEGSQSSTGAMLVVPDASHQDGGNIHPHI